MLDVVIPACVEYGIDFKIVGDPTLHSMLNSKRQARGSSGKFMTIYPPSEELFIELIELLYQQTKYEAFAGPRILSDRQYKDSNILFYRYGGFLSYRTVNIDGTHTLSIVSPGGENVPDRRLPYFDLPDWVQDPFCERQKSIVDDSQEVLLRDRYLIEKAIGFSNAGGVYRGVDLDTGRAILAKEARPFVNQWLVGDHSWDAVDLLKREYHFLRLLKSSPYVPNAVDLFEDGGHFFLIEELLDGIDLRTYWARNDVVFAPYVRRPGRIQQWLPVFKNTAITLIRAVADVHGRGILLGDLSPNNIIINPETLQMWLVDFESAVTSDDDPEIMQYASSWGTPGFVAPMRATRMVPAVEDDLYSVAMILCSAVAPVNPLFTLNPNARDNFLDMFIGLGVPLEVKSIIFHLIEGDANEAEAILLKWEL
ncbi:hypothetical protein ITP53_34360 [Nonomuraea sp. K274]|uniref:Protein kinase domain-containing protein n=1 Tax=Nonomuraea cypriaca TaxID=1187855 RepID=A0A931AEY6_9ACTN|nr:hypothetical protein [Nonomuraea cypriaca]